MLAASLLESFSTAFPLGYIGVGLYTKIVGIYFALALVLILIFAQTSVSVRSAWISIDLNRYLCLRYSKNIVEGLGKRTFKVNGVKIEKGVDFLCEKSANKKCYYCTGLRYPC
jgi:hypothetical protein